MATAMLDLPARGTPLSKTMRPRLGSVTIDRGLMERGEGGCFTASPPFLTLRTSPPDQGGRRRPDPAPRQPFFNRQPLAPILSSSRLVRTMEINARVISGLDPGAIPGGSTNSHSRPRYRRAGLAGPNRIDRRLKALLSLGVAHRSGPKT